MNKLFTIQVNVPICPNCQSALKKNRIRHEYLCGHCKSIFIIEQSGMSDREVVCRERR